MTLGQTGLLDAPSEQTVASLLILLGYLLVTGAIYAVGELIKQRLANESTEALQTLAGMVAAIVAGAALVNVWNQTDAVVTALENIKPSVDALVRGLIALLAVGVTYTLTRITKRFVQVSEDRDAISRHQREILHHVVQIALFVPAFLFVLGLFKVGAGNVLLSASVLGVVFGFAARQTLGAVLAGFVLLFSRPFELGDWVEIADHEGVVTDITIVNTEVRTFDDELVLLPNDEITQRAVINRTKSDRLRVQVDVGVDYGTDVEHAMSVAAEAMAEVDVVESQPNPDVVVESFGDSAVVLTLRFYITNPSIRRKWDAQNAVMERVKTAFEREGITIPFPQRVLSGRERAGGLAVRDVEEGSDDPERTTEQMTTDGGDEDGGSGDE